MYGKASRIPDAVAAVDSHHHSRADDQPPATAGAAGAPRLLDAGGYSEVKQTQAEPDRG